MTIPDDYVRTHCQPGAGPATCRFLMMGADGWHCAKLTSLAEMINARVKARTMGARGDNCPGWTEETR